MAVVLFHRYILKFGSWYLVLREGTTIGDEQFGCMPGRGKTEAIFAVRQRMEKHRGNRKDCIMAFIELDSESVGLQDKESLSVVHVICG